MRPYGVWAVIAPFNFPIALAAGPDRRRARHRQHRRPQVRHRHALGGAAACRLHPRRGPARRRLQLPERRRAPRSASSWSRDARTSPASTFTGSVAVGRAIMSEMAAGAYPRPYIAEMGGKNPAIVTENADLDRAAAGIARSAYGMGGQKCSALSRLYVHEKVADALLAKIEQEIDKIRIGDPAAARDGTRPGGQQARARGLRALRGGPEGAAARSSAAAAASRRRARSAAAITWSRCSRKRIRPIRSGSRRCSCRS